MRVLDCRNDRSGLRGADGWEVVLLLGPVTGIRMGPVRELSSALAGLDPASMLSKGKGRSGLRKPSSGGDMDMLVTDECCIHQHHRPPG